MVIKVEEIKAIKTKSDAFISQYQAALSTVNKILNSQSDNILIDFSNIIWVAPTFIAPLACIINNLKSKDRNIKLNLPSNTNTRNYLDKIYFPHGIKKIKSSKSKIHLPIFSFDSKSEINTVEMCGRRIRDLLEKNSSDLPRNTIDAIYYPISETIDNVQQHSESDESILFAQYYPNKDFLDICVCDDGISIPGCYKKHGFNINTDIDSVRMAVEKGVSTKTEKRGYGLPSINNLVTKGMNGKLLVSSKYGAIYKTNQKTKPLYKYYWPGTLVSMRLKVPKKEFNFYKYLE